MIFIYKTLTSLHTTYHVTIIYLKLKVEIMIKTTQICIKRASLILLLLLC